MTASLVSCIVPVFNGARYLQEALDSILQQSAAPLELIVIDDGSTDATAAVIAAYEDRVRSVRQPNAGPAAARNRGLCAARGEFVAFLDADDLWHPEKLARQMARLTVRPEIDVCLAHVQNFWVPELAAEAERFRNHPRARPLPGYVTGALLARRAIFDAVGPFDATLGHTADAAWFLRAQEHRATIEILPDVLLYRRLHERNRSRLLGTHSREEFLRLVKARVDQQRKPQPW